MTRRQRHPDARSGQTIVFLLMTLVILVFVVLWNFDVHKILHVKSVTQNAGDSAALMASRWQGITLNLVGDLNIMQALALAADDTDTAAAITNMQARLAFVGPMIAFMASQQAAKNNGIYRNPAFDELLSRHAATVRNIYPTAIGPDGDPLFPEPYTDAWSEYADMLDLIADDGVAAGPDNARFFTDASGDHVLLMPGFYEAVAGRLWCWFYHHAPDLLEDYDDYRWWPPLPELPHREYINSEIFGLGLQRRVVALDGLVDLDYLGELADTRGLDEPSGTNIPQAAWYCYHPDTWDEWEVMRPETFPIVGHVKPPYDYAGADAAVRLQARVQRLSPGSQGRTITNAITWTAAAKPFGYLDDDARPNAYGLVLPAFHDVRLIPVDASSLPAGGGFDVDWRIHVEEHLPIYMDDGPGRLPDCWYCRQLIVWEHPDFRRDGVEWLEANRDRCISHGGPGGRRGGGTRRGH